MLSNQILQKTIYEMGDILECNCSIWNIDGEMLAGVGNEKNHVKKAVELFLQNPVQTDRKQEIADDIGLFLICDEERPIYVFVIEHYKKIDANISGRLCVSQWQSLLEMNKVKMDKNRFMQNLILDNLLLVDVFNQAKRLMIPVEQKRVVFVVEPKEDDDELVLELVKGIYTSGTGDYVTAVDNGHVILVKSLESYEGYETVNEIANMLIDIMNTEAMINVRVAYGTIINELNAVPESYKEAAIALEVGRIFYAERSLLAYKELGIGRLIHQLPESLCEMFLEEVFGENDEAIFDEETLLTVDKFFENNLNVSETARQLFIHRNTLIHKLEKIQKYTGLDVRIFEDALTFKIALMVADQRKYGNSSAMRFKKKENN